VRFRNGKCILGIYVLMKATQDYNNKDRYFLISLQNKYYPKTASGTIITARQR
jgi:hypothetical protein